MSRNYTFTINLCHQNTTPSYVVSHLVGYNEISFPANKMPHLKPGDTLDFRLLCDEDCSVESLTLYARAIEQSEKNSPFEPQDQVNGQYLIKIGTPLQIVDGNGYWTFSILGMLNVPGMSKLGPSRLTIPFFIDPDMDVGSGTPP